MPLRLPPNVELGPVVAENLEINEGSATDVEERGRDTLILDTISEMLEERKLIPAKEVHMHVIRGRV